MNVNLSIDEVPDKNGHKQNWIWIEVKLWIDLCFFKQFYSLNFGRICLPAKSCDQSEIDKEK